MILVEVSIMDMFLSKQLKGFLDLFWLELRAINIRIYKFHKSIEDFDFFSI
jgi:hypothetical protein